MDAPKPNASMFPARKGFERIGEEATKAGEALKALGETIPANKQQGPRKPFVRPEHLTQRPFHTGLGDLRKSMPNIKIKKK